MLPVATAPSLSRSYYSRLVAAVARTLEQATEMRSQAATRGGAGAGIGRVAAAAAGIGSHPFGG